MGFGYTKASLLRRKVDRVTSKQSVGRASTVTEPNTRQRQDLLMGCKTAGNFFSIMNGGGPMTCDDMLYAFIRKNMQEKIAEMEKRKKNSVKGDDTALKAKKILEKQPDCMKWKRDDIMTLIRWKQGKNPVEPYNHPINSKLLKPALLAPWRSVYAELEPPDGGDSWTQEDEDELERLKAGEALDFEEESGIRRCWETEDAFIATRLLSFTKARREKILSMVANEEVDASPRNVTANLKNPDDYLTDNSDEE